MRILADRPYASQPFCISPGCIVGNAAQRRRREDIVKYIAVAAVAASDAWRGMHAPCVSALDTQCTTMHDEARHRLRIRMVNKRMCMCDRRLEAVREEVGFTSTAEPTAEGRWVPLFFNGGIRVELVEAGEEAAGQKRRQKCTFYGCREAEPGQ